MSVWILSSFDFFFIVTTFVINGVIELLLDHVHGPLSSILLLLFHGLGLLEGDVSTTDGSDTAALCQQFSITTKSIMILVSLMMLLFLLLLGLSGFLKVTDNLSLDVGALLDHVLDIGSDPVHLALHHGGRGGHALLHQ